MRKEAWYAIVAGLLLGLIIAFGVARINGVFNKKNGPTPQPSAAPQKPEQLDLTVAKPNDDEVITASPTAISGITAPNSWVIISGTERDYVIRADANGTFEYEIELKGGVNLLVINAVGKDDQIQTKNLRVVYSTEVGKKAVPEASSKPASGEAEIRNEVEKKVAEALANPQAYLGTVTDIAEGTIQLKTDAGEIEQVSTTGSVVVIKTNGNKEVKLTDIAIGDYLVAMGSRNGNHVLNAERILITAPASPLNIKVLAGKIISVNQKEIVIGESKIQIASATKFTATKNNATANIKLSSLAENDPVIAIAATSDTKLSARRVHLLEK